MGRNPFRACFFNFDSFSKFLSFGGNISANSTVLFVKKKSDFLTPMGPLGADPYRFEQK
jgi:hypothetical protein